jgi:hypothetical protein
MTLGSSWILEIALSGFPAAVQPHELFSPAKDYVETSGDVIGIDS